MSQLRMRQVPLVCDDDRSKAPGKASGDNGLKQQNQKNTHRNKIPKSVRYDLEKALISLCDLWFEDIKPHLVTNNIKLHVHDGGHVDSASGDYDGRAVVGAPGCSHLDPGAASDQRRPLRASCADYYSTLRTASKVRSPKLRPRQHLSPPSPALRPTLQINLPHATSSSNPGCNSTTKRLPRRKSRQPQTHLLLQSNWRVPRLCRTSSILSPICSSRCRMPRIQPALPPQNIFGARDDDFVQSTQLKHRVKIKHKSTQTEMILYHSGSVAPTRSTSPTHFVHCLRTIPPKRRKPKQNVQQSCPNSKPLFSNDLVNIIAEKHNKNLRLLCRSPQREDCTSFMNLIQSSDDKSKIFSKVGKKKVWR